MKPKAQTQVTYSPSTIPLLFNRQDRMTHYAYSNSFSYSNRNVPSKEKTSNIEKSHNSILKNIRKLK